MLRLDMEDRNSSMLQMYLMRNLTPKPNLLRAHSNLLVLQLMILSKYVNQPRKFRWWAIRLADMNELNQQLPKSSMDRCRIYNLSEFMDECLSSMNLYTQRMNTNCLAFNSNPSIAWKSKEHSDDSMFLVFFIVGVITPLGQYTYHYKLEHWDLFKCPWNSERAPEWELTHF